MTKDTLLICCDIEGTINIDGITTEKMIKNLILIDRIRNLIKAKQTVFSFISADNLEVVMSYYKLFSKLFEYCNEKYHTKFEMGIQYSSDICYNPCSNTYIKCSNHKEEQMKELYNFLEKRDIGVKELIFIDDNVFMTPILMAAEPHFNKKINTKELSMTFITKNDNFISDELDNVEGVNLFSHQNKDFVEVGLQKRLKLHY